MTHHENNLGKQSVESTTLGKIADFAKQIESSFAGAITTLELFPSGCAMLDVRWCNRLFVVDYSPTNGFGVDEISEEDSFNMGYNFNTKDFCVAVEHLRKLMKSVDS